MGGSHVYFLGKERSVKGYLGTRGVCIDENLTPEIIIYSNLKWFPFCTQARAASSQSKMMHSTRRAVALFAKARYVLVVLYTSGAILNCRTHRLAGDGRVCFSYVPVGVHGIIPADENEALNEVEVIPVTQLSPTTSPASTHTHSRQPSATHRELCSSSRTRDERSFNTRSRGVSQSVTDRVHPAESIQLPPRNPTLDSKRSSFEC